MFIRLFKQQLKQLSRCTGYPGSGLMKASRIPNLVFAFCISLGLFASPQVGFGANDGVNITAIVKNLKSDNTYNSSVVLYAASLLNNSELYSKALSDIKTQLREEKGNSFKAWMLGRILLAAKNMQDKATVQETLAQLKSVLQEPDLTKDAFRAWALAYLAALNPEEYKANKEEMLTAANALTKPADALWAHVMNLQAAARTKDKPTFELILDQMKKFTNKPTVEKALAQIPENDWQAWAMGIATESAALMGEVNLYQNLRQSLSLAVASAIKNNGSANAALAQISANTADALMQSHHTQQKRCRVGTQRAYQTTVPGHKACPPNYIVPSHK